MDNSQTLKLYLGFGGQVVYNFRDFENLRLSREAQEKHDQATGMWNLLERKGYKERVWGILQRNMQAFAQSANC